MTDNARDRRSRDRLVTGVEHWTDKGDVRLFLWEKFVGSPDGKPAVLFVHGSSMASQPTFDLTVPGRPDSSVMDWFARRGFAAGRVDMEGYGRSDKIARHLLRHRQRRRRSRRRDRLHREARAASSSFLTYGISSGALRAALFAQRHPDARGAARARRVRVDRRRRADARRSGARSCPSSWRASAARSTARSCYSIFERDHPGYRRQARRRCVRRRDPRARRFDAERHLHRHVLAAADRRSRRRSPCRRWCCAAQYDGIAAFDDLIEFFKRLPNPDKQFTVMRRHLARELPAEELPDGLSHPARVVHAARAGVRGSCARLSR